MIEKLGITNFRGIKKTKLELSPITILLGPNNSAKSTILEAIFLAPNPCRLVPYADPETKQHYTAVEVFYFLHKTLDYKGYAFLLHNYTSKNARIQINEEEYVLEFFKFHSSIYLTSSSLHEAKWRHGTLHIEDEEIPFFAQIPLAHLQSSVQESTPFIGETLLLTPKLLRLCYEYMRQQWAVIVNSGIARKVASDASMFSLEDYDDFTLEPVIGGQLDINAYLKDGRRIRLGDLGEGIQSYAMSRILFELADPKVLLWDDIESHLNPRMLLNIANWFNKLVENKKQVIISTHSLEAAKIIAGVNEEQARICLTSLEKSTFKTKKLTLSELEELQAAGIDARTAEAFLL